MSPSLLQSSFCSLLSQTRSPVLICGYFSISGRSRWMEFYHSLKPAVFENTFANQPAGVSRASEAVFSSTDQQSEIESSAEIVEIRDMEFFVAIDIRRGRMAVPSLDPQSD